MSLFDRVEKRIRSYQEELDDSDLDIGCYNGMQIALKIFKEEARVHESKSEIDKDLEKYDNN